MVSFLSARVEKTFPFELSASGFLDGYVDAGTEQTIGLVEVIDERLLERRLGPHDFIKLIEYFGHLGLEIEAGFLRLVVDFFALGPKRRVDVCDGSLNLQRGTDGSPQIKRTRRR